MAQLEWEKDDSKNYKVEAICNNKTYTRELEDYLETFSILFFGMANQKKKITRS